MKKAIYCPQCGRKMFDYDSRRSIPVSKKCNKCHKLVSYSGWTGETRITEIPLRKSSSGTRYY